MKKLLLPLLLLVSLYYVGCATAKPDLPKTETGTMPEWFLNTPEDPNYIFAAKSEPSMDMQMAIDKATQACRAEISRQVEVKISGIEKQFKEEVGMGADANLLSQFTTASKSITNSSLVGSKIKKKEIVKEGANFRAYVLMVYPVGAANQALVEALKKNKETYTRFQSSKTFEELDKEIEKSEKAQQK